jgi:hypothetical protein
VFIVEQVSNWNKSELDACTTLHAFPTRSLRSGKRAHSLAYLGLTKDTAALFLSFFSFSPSSPLRFFLPTFSSRLLEDKSRLAGTFLSSMKFKMRRRGSPPIDSTEPNPNISDDSTLLQKAKTRVLLLFDELPEWAKDNESDEYQNTRFSS